MMKSLLDSAEKNRSQPICDFCLANANNNKHGMYEEMLFCKDCQAKAHPSCMNYNKALAVRALSYPWQCVECKTCSICCTAQDGASILFCDACDKAYHMKCHEPEVNIKPEAQGKWICASCVDEDAGNNGSEFSYVETKMNGGNESDLSNNGILTGSLSPSSSTANMQINHIPPSLNNNATPNSVNWTAPQVSDYFKSVGFPDQASVFTREEIDGKSLLLLRRSDVISGLSLKLGPAVKIYEHIMRLQNASSHQDHRINGVK